MQRHLVGRTDELETRGFAKRSFSTLAEELSAGLRYPDVTKWLTVPEKQIALVTCWLNNAVVALHDLAIPETLVHGDFHPRNVTLVDGAAVLLDWSDAAIANPVVDIFPWLEWLNDDEDAQHAVWEAFLESWSDAIDVEAVRAKRHLLSGLGHAFHCVSYINIIKGCEPIHAGQHADGLTGHFKKLTALLTEHPVAASR